MKILRAPVYLPVTWLFLACASIGPQPALPGFGKSLASEMDGLETSGLDIVHADDAGKLWVEDAERPKKRALVSDLNRSGFELTAAARGLVADGGAFRWEWLATLSREPDAELSVLSIHDAEGRLAHEEVLLEDCASLTWRESDVPELLVGCGERVWRYLPGAAGEPIVTNAQLSSSGRTFGPLSFGDGTARVHAALQLVGAECRTEKCTLWTLRLGQRDFLVGPGFQDGKLARLTVFGPRRPRSEWWTRVRGDWVALTSAIAGTKETPDVSLPPSAALKPTSKLEGWTLAETHHVEREGATATLGLYGDEDGKSVGAIAVIVPSAGAAPTPANAAD